MMLKRVSLVFVIAVIVAGLVLSCKKSGSDAPGSAPSASGKSYDADAFYNMVFDKSRAEVEAKLGKPMTTESQDGMEFLIYDLRVKDKHGKEYAPKIQIDNRQQAVAIILMPYEELNK